MLFLCSSLERHVIDKQGSPSNTSRSLVRVPRFYQRLDGHTSPSAFNALLSPACSVSLRLTWGTTGQAAVQNDGVQLGSDHERGEQHRWGQRAHHALLLQTGGSLLMCTCCDYTLPLTPLFRVRLFNQEVIVLHLKFYYNSCHDFKT